MEKSSSNDYPELEVSATVEDMKGVYSNLARVSYNKNEFVLGFIFHIGNEANLVSRIIVSPEHLKQINEVISQTLEEHKEKFGDHV